MEQEAEYAELPASKAELLERVQREHALLEQAIARLSEAQLTAPIDGDWSAKDMLAHLTAWEQLMREFHMGGTPFNQAAGLDGVTYGVETVDQINEAFHRRDRDKPLAEVLAAFRDSYERTLAAIAAIDEARLFGAYTPPGRDVGGPLVDWVAGDTYDHYREHRLTIERLATPSG